MSALSEALFDVLDGEANHKYFLWKTDEGTWAKFPAIIICSGPFAKLGIHSWSVYFGRGIADWTVKNEKQARMLAMEILEKSKIERPFRVKHVFRSGREEILNIGRPNE